MTIETRFASFDDYWAPFLEKQGPAGAYVATLSAREREESCRPAPFRAGQPTCRSRPTRSGSVITASVQRLMRDGVDTPLANLFVQIARTVPPDAEGADRARSASEAFLDRRLQTLSETRDRFRLNASLPLGFDGTGAVEVDLLCDDARVAVELDGAQHLNDPAAHRRDRPKDQLLQENGYLVLRMAGVPARP